MGLILEKILADKRIEIDSRKSQWRIDELKTKETSPPRDFRAALAVQKSSAGRGPSLIIRLIAEVKKASPSKGLIRSDFDPVAIARAYEEAGASAISVLTDEKYFQGRLEYLTAVRNAVNLPVLRKDFIIDAFQVYEARMAQADAILLIMAALSKSQLAELMALASDLGMACLVEVHTAEELEVALESGAEIIGINNRNLQTFETKLETTVELAKMVPGDRILVSESGIFTRLDVERLMEAGVDAILVGESLMREPDPRVKVRELLTSA
ncbi:MAG: indole-3-glycerol phosphate synthase TrpC [Armatimonadetes bacterium]|nr:indole-3-glycerol phosphate synthase TrpC [Armatimonadota bacterium]